MGAGGHRFRFLPILHGQPESWLCISGVACSDPSEQKAWWKQWAEPTRKAAFPVKGRKRNFPLLSSQQLSVEGSGGRASLALPATEAARLSFISWMAPCRCCWGTGISLSCENIFNISTDCSTKSQITQLIWEVTHLQKSICSVWKENENIYYKQYRQKQAFSITSSLAEEAILPSPKVILRRSPGAVYARKHLHWQWVFGIKPCLNCMSMKVYR